MVLHGIVQLILGFPWLSSSPPWLRPASEVRLELSNLAQPILDLIANPTAFKTTYPTEPFEIPIEILSLTDSLKQTIAEAAHYIGRC
jgi:hypothetical protein